MYLSYCFDLLVRWLDKITKIVPKRCVHQPWPIKAKHHKINFAIVKFQMPKKKIFISIFCLPLSFIYFSNHPGSPNTKLCLLVVGWIIPKTILCLVLDFQGSWRYWALLAISWNFRAFTEFAQGSTDGPTPLGSPNRFLCNTENHQAFKACPGEWNGGRDRRSIKPGSVFFGGRFSDY